MISRVTLFTLLLALLLGTGIRLHDAGLRDDCARYLAGEKKLPAGEKELPAGEKEPPASQYVISGTRVIVVPCTEWLPRQTMAVQMLCLTDLVLAVLFVVNALQDVQRWLQTVRRRRAAGWIPPA